MPTGRWRCLDAMALPKKFGKPDLFITVTCNPHWPEIRNALPENSHWTHHRDIVERVFMIKLRSLTKDIVKQEIFGSVLAYVYRVEWQARGLPHAHMLFILKDHSFFLPFLVPFNLGFYTDSVVLPNV